MDNENFYNLFDEISGYIDELEGEAEEKDKELTPKDYEKASRKFINKLSKKELREIVYDAISIHHELSLG